MKEHAKKPAHQVIFEIYTTTVDHGIETTSRVGENDWNIINLCTNVLGKSYLPPGEIPHMLSRLIDLKDKTFPSSRRPDDLRLRDSLNGLLNDLTSRLPTE